MAMVEVGYRYKELYWAGIGMNWEYAQYQLDKMELAIKNGFERRPLREASGQKFVDESIPEMRNIINQRDTSLFKKEFLLFTSQCNHCHIKEALPFFRVELPTTRNSIIR